MAGTMPLRKAVHLRVPPVEAWEAFTERFGEWWPLETHSHFGGDAASCHLEAAPGGRVYEVSGSGDEVDWGSVEAAERPSRLVLDWQPSPSRPAPTRVEILFSPAGDGSQLVLMHRGWERLGDAAREARDEYDARWDVVMARFREAL